MELTKSYRSVLTWMFAAVLAVTLIGCQDSSERNASSEEMMSAEKMNHDMQESMDELKQETQELRAELRDYSVDQRDKAIERSNRALENLDRRIDALEQDINNDWDRMNEASREKARAELEALREQRNEASSWVDKMKNSTEDAWDDTKEGFSDAYQSLGNAWENTKDEFRSDK